MSASGGATKESLRRHFRALRQWLVERAQPAIEAQAQKQVTELLADGRLLGLYCPLPGEINLLSLQNLLPGQLARQQVLQREQVDLAGQGPVEAK